MRIAVLVPCYKRPEYTKLCLEALEKAQDYGDQVRFFLVDDGSNDGTDKLIIDSKLTATKLLNKENQGLRTVILDFFKRTADYDLLCKVDNDCLVPKDWLKKVERAFELNLGDILSPNVVPSNVAYKIGKDTGIEGLRSSEVVGGLWCMRSDLIHGMCFEPIQTEGIRGAFPVLQQIIVEKEPRLGWLTSVEVEDVGHYSGQHPLHIKSQEHLEYSQEVGRSVSWA